MNSKSTQVADLIEPAVQAQGCELLGCEYVPRGRRSILRVYIDSPKGVHIDDCEKVSRQVSALLDVEDPISGEYHLEVSSPGINRPLFKVEHFQQQLGKTVKIRLALPLNGRRNFLGIMTAVTEDNITLQCDNEALTLPFANVSSAKLVVDLD